MMIFKGNPDVKELTEENRTLNLIRTNSDDLDNDFGNDDHLEIGFSLQWNTSIRNFRSTDR